MEKRQQSFKTGGMNRDLSVSAFNSKFSFENMNLRLVTNEGNTSMSWVNEKGPALLELSLRNGEERLSGTPIGTAVINHTLIVFTTNENDEHSPDRIYKLNYDADKGRMYGSLLYQGDLDFSVGSPLETLVSYESDTIQKVYWTDGRNQPRVINIAADEDVVQKWTTVSGTVDSYFDFVPVINSSAGIKVTKDEGGGTFAPGVIQYCFTYLNKYGQQSNIVDVSPLYYLCHPDRGAAADDSVSCSFTITVERKKEGEDDMFFDRNFNYLRIYSIQRTSLDSAVITRLVADVPFSDAESYCKEDSAGDDVEYTGFAFKDDGASGSAIDPEELLYIGGRDITALTMTEKDQTLFMGNITVKDSVVDDIQRAVYDKLGKNAVQFDADKKLVLDIAKGIYSYTNEMKDGGDKDITTFKGGETYRFGFQLQKKDGEWLDPVFIGDYENGVYPVTSVYDNTVRLVTAEAGIPLKDLVKDISKYRKIRPVVVYPDIQNRTVLCQGVLNPTVFNAFDRIDNSPFAQASWFFRPYMVNTTVSSEASSTVGSVLAKHVKAEEVGLETWNAVSNTDSYIKNNQEVVYALVANVTDAQLSSILEDGYIYGSIWYSFDIDTGDISNPGKYYTHEFDRGYVRLTDYGGTGLYAFFSSDRWFGELKLEINGVERFLEDQHDGNYFVVRYLANNEGLDVVSAGNDNGTAVSIYKYLKQQDYSLYFQKGIGEEKSDEYYLKIKYYDDDEVHYWIVTFTAYGSATAKLGDKGKGSGLSYLHYAPLKAQGDMDYNSPEGAEEVEIQGSVNYYDGVFDTKSAGEAKSNSQFFVDQSVVTLNSPDLDVDTDVQLWSKENLKLRVVGAVPITANTSSHSITTSSNMLEVNHNTEKASGKFGAGELDVNAVYQNISLFAGHRLVSDYLWNDVTVISDTDKDDKIRTANGYSNFLVFPWQRSGSLNNDWRSEGEASSYLKTKKESDLLFSSQSEYLSKSGMVDFGETSVASHLTENDHVINYRLARQKETMEDANYYPNIDKVLYNTDGYKPIADKINYGNVNGPVSDYVLDLTSPVSMKYKSTSHLAIALRSEDGSRIPLLPYDGTDTYKDKNDAGGTVIRHYGEYENAAAGEADTFWNDTDMMFTQRGVDMSKLFVSGGVHQPFNFLWLGELYKEPANRFGGTSKSALMANTWLVGGDAVDIGDGRDVRLVWDRGDTYYQRYDCLKTYAFTPEDANQIVEILSFMCETHVNMDGRYDRNRGQIDNTDMSPQNFGLVNTAYSQRDNYFNYRILDNDANKGASYPNQVYYTKTKTSGADVDLYTNVSLGSVLELDGDKGGVRGLRRLGGNILAFQDSGISQILYNDNVQISSTAGVPIEIANSGKVGGKRYLSEAAGCSNKWSLCSTPSGIYFIDSNDKGVYLLGGENGLTNLSLAKGFNSWSRNNIPDYSGGWNPSSFGDFVTYYDRVNGDVLLISEESCLAYSERTGTFTSFYSYGGVPYLVNLDNVGIWIRPDGGSSDLYLHNGGAYSTFFGETRPYWMTLVCNPEPSLSKTFTNVELRATVEGDGNGADDEVFRPTLPFDSAEAWNEYQHGYNALANLLGRHLSSRYAFRHDGYGKNGDRYNSLKRKFRIWRCDMPRDNAATDSSREEGAAYAYGLDSDLGVTRFKAHPLDRMHNPWMYLKMKKDFGEGDTPSKTEIHDITVTYYI